MTGRGLIEIREPPDGVWDNAPPLTMTEISDGKPLGGPGVLTR